MREHLREGAARQALVIVDLLRRGFEVFAEVGNSSFDLVAHKDGTLIKIEVKGPLHAKERTIMAFTKAQYDILQQMIDASIERALDDSTFADMADVENAVQGAASDARSDLEELETRVNGLENDIQNIDDGNE